jgi:hypothetical protein
MKCLISLSLRTARLLLRHAVPDGVIAVPTRPMPRSPALAGQQRPLPKSPAGIARSFRASGSPSTAISDIRRRQFIISLYGEMNASPLTGARQPPFLAPTRAGPGQDWSVVRIVGRSSSIRRHWLMTNGRCGSAAEEPIVCQLTAGASEIRNPRSLWPKHERRSAIEFGRVVEIPRGSGLPCAIVVAVGRSPKELRRPVNSLIRRICSGRCLAE